MAGWTKAKRSAAAKKAARTRKRNATTKATKRKVVAGRRKRATGKKKGGKKRNTAKRNVTYSQSPQKKASDKIINSEGRYMEILKQQFGNKSVVFKTGNVDREKYPEFVGVPDIAKYSDKKLEFYEIKPAVPYRNRNNNELKDLKASFLKPQQMNWIRNNCVEKGRKGLSPHVNLVFYKKGKNFTYFRKKLHSKNLAKYSREDDEKSRKRTLRRIIKKKFSQKYQ